MFNIHYSLINKVDYNFFTSLLFKFTLQKIYSEVIVFNNILNSTKPYSNCNFFLLQSFSLFFYFFITGFFVVYTDVAIVIFIIIFILFFF